MRAQDTSFLIRINLFRGNLVSIVFYKLSEIFSQMRRIIFERWTHTNNNKIFLVYVSQNHCCFQSSLWFTLLFMSLLQVRHPALFFYVVCVLIWPLTHYLITPFDSWTRTKRRLRCGVSNLVNRLWTLQMGHVLFGLDFNIQGQCGHSEVRSCLCKCSFAFDPLFTAIDWHGGDQNTNTVCGTGLLKYTNLSLY